MKRPTLPPPFTVLKSNIELLGDSISHETGRAIEQLLALSKRRSNRLIGIAFTGMLLSPDGRHFFTNAAGEMYRNPNVARGYVAQLDDCLGQLSRGEQPIGWE